MSASREKGNLTKMGKTTSSLIKTSEKLSNTSAPFELLTEFLFSIMTKNYEKALNYCTQILDYEPKNSKALQFYPLILEKLKMELESSSSESCESDSSESLETSESSENSSSDTEINLQEPSKSFRSTEVNALEEISGRLGSNVNSEKHKID